MPRKKRFSPNGRYRARALSHRNRMRAIRGFKSPDVFRTKKLSNVPCDRLLGGQGLNRIVLETDTIQDGSLEEEREPGNPSVMDFLQVKMEPQNDEDGECAVELTQDEDDELLKGIRLEVAVPDYESNSSSYGQGRYSRRNCQQFKCKFGECRKTFATEQEIQFHVSEHVNDMRITYVCDFPGCGARFLVRTTAAKHAEDHSRKLLVRKYSTDRPNSLKTLHRCDFDGCGREFAQHCFLVYHARVHASDKPYACSEQGCVLRFASREECDGHIAAHGKGEAFVCTFNECGLAFRHDSGLQMHRKTMHTGEKPFKCSVVGCGQRLSTKFLFDVHARTHKLLRRFVCKYEGCDKRYRYEYSLDKHMLKHRSAKCPFHGCLDLFPDKETVERHAALHTGDMPFPCTLNGCDARFKSFRSMVNHRRAHKLEQLKVKCGYSGCGQVMRITYLKFHYRTHHGTAMKHQCPVEGCGEIFKLKQSFDKHVQHCRLRINFICVFEGCNEEYIEESHFMEHFHKHTDAEPAID